MSESRVKVCLRIRPLVGKERGQRVTFSDCGDKRVMFKDTAYVFDNVFGMDVPQSQLHLETAAPILRGFMEGYNCSIMAYGQTGSGKTFTMGASDATSTRIPSDAGDTISYQVKVSYLEVYGEDIHDLLDDSSASIHSRVPLPIREDKGGKFFVQGLSYAIVESAESTLKILANGTKHRKTVATAMNASSSRSHAVFTIYLEQRVRVETDSIAAVNSKRPFKNNNLPPSTTAGIMSEQVVSSKLTFVDLAGSESNTRADNKGQRLVEGIQINLGLFNLGRVISELAAMDDSRRGGTPVKGGSGGGGQHCCQFRNSKLTLLLKDALGGNSQTLFIACVSPAESNESETLSTLMYAKQVCGIRNQPIRNVEKRSSEQFELQELRKRVRQLETDRQRSIEMVEQSVRDLEEARRCCSEQLISVQEKHRAIVLELEGRVSELQCDNLRMEQRLLDMEYSSYSSTRRIEGGGGDSSSRGSSSRGMTLIDDVLRDYSRRTQFVDDNDDHDDHHDHHHHQRRRSSDVDDVNAVKRKSIVDVMDESRDKRSRRQSSSLLEPGEHHRVVDGMVSNGQEDITGNRFGSDHTIVGNDDDNDDDDDVKHSECKGSIDRDEPSSSTTIRPYDKPSSTTKKHTVFKAMNKLRRRMLRIVDGTRFIKADRDTNSS